MNTKVRSLELILTALVASAGLLPEARAQVSLGSAASFGVLGASTVTSTGNTTIEGDLGVYDGTAITGFPPGIVYGEIHGVIDGTIYGNAAVAAQAQADALTAYNDLAGLTGSLNLSGSVLGLGIPEIIPGIYYFGSSAQLTGQLTLDGQGDPNARFVFQIGSDLTTATDSSVLLINGAQAGNVFWQVGTSATIGTRTDFCGSILADQSITLNTGADLLGRALALNAAVTLDSNIIIVPEPAGLGLLFAGFLALFAGWRRMGRQSEVRAG